MSERERCKKDVWKPGAFRPNQCKRIATLDGYCLTHHPVAVEKRRARNDAVMDARLQAERDQRLKPIRDAVAARDAEWRAAVERVRCEPVNRTAVHLAIVRAHNAALDALLAAMEAK